MRARQSTSARGIDESLEKFADVRTGTMRMVARLTEQQAGFVPGPKQWSIAQNLDHLLVSEALYRSQIKRLVDMAREGKRSRIDLSLNKQDVGLPFVPQLLMPLISLPLSTMNMFVPAVFRETVIRFPVMKAKNPKILEPAPARPINDLREHLENSLAETQAVLAGELPPNIGRVTMSHPLFGRNTIANILGLLAAHEERHRTQIAGVLRHPAFPSGVMV